MGGGSSAAYERSMSGACSLRSWISALRDCWMRAVMPFEERPNALGFCPLTVVLPARRSFLACFLSALVPDWFGALT
jgi:hypothetical protein